MNKSNRVLLLVMLILVLGGCAPTLNVTMGQMPSQDPGARIEAGLTTKAEILELFGEPDFTGIDSDGLPKWTWTHMGIRIKGGKDASITSFFNLEVSFDGEMVSSYSYSKKAE